MCHVAQDIGISTNERFFCFIAPYVKYEIMVHYSTIVIECEESFIRCEQSKIWLFSYEVNRLGVEHTIFLQQFVKLNLY